MNGPTEFDVIGTPAQLGPHRRPRAHHAADARHLRPLRRDHARPAPRRSRPGIPGARMVVFESERALRAPRGDPGLHGRGRRLPRRVRESAEDRAREAERERHRARRPLHGQRRASSATIQRDGFVVVRDLVAPAEIDELREHTEALMAGELPEQRAVAAERARPSTGVRALQRAAADAVPGRRADTGAGTAAARPQRRRAGAVVPARAHAAPPARAARALPAPPAGARRARGADRPRRAAPCSRCCS